MNESEIRPKEKIEDERSKKIPSFQSKIDDTMQFIIEKLHEQKLKCKPHGRSFPTGVLFLSMMNHQLMFRCHRSRVVCCVTIDQ
jgi:hypothetical protein